MFWWQQPLRLAWPKRRRLSASSNQSQKAAEAERKAKVKEANRRFNKRYGKKVPRSKGTKVRIDETRNQVRIFNKEAATFWTAKTFGVHKQLVIMKYCRERLDGRTVGITWNK